MGKLGISKYPHLMRRLPRDPKARVKEYRRRYNTEWRQRHPDYMKRYYHHGETLPAQEYKFDAI